MQKRILLSLLLGVIFSISIFSQNLKVEKITLPDSEFNQSVQDRFGCISFRATFA